MRVVTRLLGASLLGLGLISAAAASAATIVGRVRDSSNDSYMLGATVSIRELGRTATTSSNGEYVLTNVPVGEYTVVASYLGFDDSEQKVSVSAGTDTAHVNFEMGGVVKLGNFVVEGTREGQARALQQKRAANNIMDVVSADAMGKFPDGNAAESLRRMPGISLEIDQDEGRYVVVRGIDSALNTVTLNNQLLGTPSEQGNRGVALDSVPAELIARLEVVKAVTPDMDATAIGGSINIVTQSAFDRADPFFVYGQVAGFYDDFSEDFSPRGSLTVGRVLDEAERWGIVAGISYSKKEFKSQTSDDDGWTLTDNGIWLPFSQASYDYEVMRERMGVNVALQFRPMPGHELALRVNHNEFTDEEGRNLTDFEFGRGTLSNQTPTSGSFSQGRATKEFRSYHQTGTIQALSLEGDHRIHEDYKLTWQVGTSHGERDVPKRDDWEYRSSGSAFPNSYDLSSGKLIVTPNAAFYDPARYPFRRVRFRHDLEEEDVFSVQSDLRRDTQFGTRNGFWKVGAKFVTRDKADDRENENYVLDGTAFTLAEPGLASPEPEGYFEGRYRQGPGLNLAANEAFFAANPSRFEFDELGSLENSVAGDFEAQEDVIAAYAMASIDFNERLNLIAGVRFEGTQASYSGNELEVIDGDFTGNFHRVTGDTDYTNVMPGLHLSWRPNDRMIVRFAWTNTLGRPNYVDLAPIREFDQIEDPVGSGTWIGSLSTGNPNLKPYESQNFDLSFEYYLRNAGIVSVGAFHKEIDNPVFGRDIDEVDVTRDGRFYSFLSTSMPDNADKGEITGVELNYQSFFNFLPSPFDGLGLNLNYTITTSSATLFTRSDELPFFKQSDRIGNIALLYEKYGFEARVAMSFQSPFLTDVGGGPETDVYNEERSPIDAKISYRITPHMRIFAEFLNLNEEPLPEYVGNNSRYNAYEIYRWKANFGINFNL